MNVIYKINNNIILNKYDIIYFILLNIRVKMEEGGVDSHFHLPHGSGNPTPHSKIKWGPQSGIPTLPLKFASKY